jgi:hypothetical protein
MRARQTRFLRDSNSHSTTVATLGAVLWLWLTLLSVREVSGQGIVIFNNRIPGGAGVGLTLHIWGPSSTNPSLALIGLGSNDSPSGTTPFGSASGMALIGANGSGGQYGYATTFAQLIGAVGASQPESALVPVGQTTTFRSGTFLGNVVSISDTLSAVPPYTNTIPEDAPAATFEIVAWDNSSDLYPTWAQASVAWMQGLIAAGHSAPFTVTAIGDLQTNVPPYLNNGQGSANGMTSFNLAYPCLSCWYPPRAWTLLATDVTANSAVLRGQIDPNGYSTTAWFRWGTTTAWGNTTDPTDAGSCYCNSFLATLVTGLTPGTTYHFRAAAANIYGGAIYPGPWPYDGDQSFTTPSLSTLTISTGSGYWDAASSTLRYTGDTGVGGGSHSFILLQSTDPSAPLSTWSRIATNNTTPGSFFIPPVGTAGANYYRVKSE